MRRELWIISGTDPVTWAIPFWFDKDGRRCLIYSAMGLTPYQRAAADKRIGSADRKTICGTEKIYISQTRLKSIAEPAMERANPETYFVWQRERDGANRPRRSDLNEFLSRLYLKGVGKSEGEVEFWWTQFCNNILWWLVNRETPIDMMFCRLHPSPLRMGWQKDMNRARQEDGALLAGQGNACLRGVDLELKSLWTRVSRRVELDRLKILGNYGYAKEYLEWKARYSETARRLHAQWLIYSRIKSPRLISYSPSDALRFTANRGGKKATQRLNRVAKAERESAAREMESIRKRQVEQARHMRDVLALRRKDSHLRHARDYIQRARNGRFTSAGLFLPHENKERAAQGDVLAEGYGD